MMSALLSANHNQQDHSLSFFLSWCWVSCDVTVHFLIPHLDRKREVAEERDARIAVASLKLPLVAMTTGVEPSRIKYETDFLWAGSRVSCFAFQILQEPIRSQRGSDRMGALGFSVIHFHFVDLQQLSMWS